MVEALGLERDRARTPAQRERRRARSGRSPPGEALHRGQPSGKLRYEPLGQRQRREHAAEDQEREHERAQEAERDPDLDRPRPGTAVVGHERRATRARCARARSRAATPPRHRPGSRACASGARRAAPRTASPSSRPRPTSESFTYGRSSSFQSITFQLSCRNCGPRRAWKNCVSSGRLPYQITMYCAKNRYIQKIENAKIILPRSCMRLDVISTSQPGVVARSSTHASAVAETPRQEAAPEEVPAEDGREPGRVQRHHLVERDQRVGERVPEADDRREHAQARARGVATPASSPRQSAVQLANMPFARVARSAAPASAGRNDVRRNTSVRSCPPRARTRRSGTRAERRASPPCPEVRRAASWCGCTRGRRSCRPGTARTRSAPRTRAPRRHGGSDRSNARR